MIPTFASRLTTNIITPAIKTPHITAFALFFIPKLSMEAANVPVHAPVPGIGIPTNNIKAIKGPFLEAPEVNFCPSNH